MCLKTNASETEGRTVSQDNNASRMSHLARHAQTNAEALADACDDEMT